MPSVPMPANERERVEAVKSYGILDTPPEAEYDAITRLASDICGTPISLITLLDETRQWFKSAHGAGDVSQSPKEHAFCAYAVLNPEQPLMVADLRKDARFAANPFVTEDPHVVFYAGVPLTDNDGFSLGTLCVLDVQEKTLNEFQLNALRVLARQVVTLLHLRRKLKTAQTFQALLEDRNEELRKGLKTALDVAPALAEVAGNIERLQQDESLAPSQEAVALLEVSKHHMRWVGDVLKKAGEAL